MNNEDSQEEQREVKELEGTSLAVLDSLVILAFFWFLPWAPWNSLKPPQDELCLRALRMFDADYVVPISANGTMVDVVDAAGVNIYALGDCLGTSSTFELLV